MSSEEATLLAATIAAGVAAIGIATQAAAHRRTARLALLEQRIRCVRPTFELLHLLRYLDYDWWTYAEARQNGRLEEVIANLVEGQRTSHESLSTAQFLFGSEVLAAIREVIHLGAVVDANQRKHMDDPIAIADMSDSAAGLIDAAESNLVSTLKPYLMKERLVGLTRLQQAERRLAADGHWFDERSGWRG